MLFRSDSMLNETKMRCLYDYFDSQDCFPGIDLSGGVCYFLWNKDYSGKCRIKSIRDSHVSEMERCLLESGNTSFIRFNEAVSILQKVKEVKENSFS